jgi:hypothetical protein
MSEEQIKKARSVPEVAAAYGVSDGLIWKEIAIGELESLLVGDRRLITDEQERRWRERKAERARQKREQQVGQSRQRLSAEAAR